MEISDLPNREFRLMVTEMLSEVRRAMHELNKNFNRDRNIKKY